jgi:hypothetical protein
MTKDELKEILDRTAEQAENLFKQNGSLSPVLFVYYTSEKEPGKEVESIGIIPIIDIGHREAIMFAMRKMFLKNNKFKRVNAIAFVSEAWMSVQCPGKGTRNVLPSQDPDRIEIASITGMTDTRESALLVFEIKDKDNQEKRKFVKNEKASNMSTIENRLLDRFWEGMGMVLKSGRYA